MDEGCVAMAFGSQVSAEVVEALLAILSREQAADSWDTNRSSGRESPCA